MTPTIAAIDVATAKMYVTRQHDVTMQDIAAILEAYGKETGLGLGED
ncbi:hypothetical protein [Streptomyces sp. NPDC020298]